MVTGGPGSGRRRRLRSPAESSSMTATWTAPPETADATRAAMDGRRALQLGLAAVWLLDGVLQYQSWMFTKAFGQMLAGAAPRHPARVAPPPTPDAHPGEHHPVL